MDTSLCFLCSVAFALGLTGCSSTQVRAGCVYPRLGLVLADGAANDCGVLSPSVNNRSRRAVQSCARQAIRSHAPVRFGAGSIGVDDAHCSVVVTDSSGQIWLLEHSYDVSVEPGEKLFVGRCSSVEFPEINASSSEYFRVAGCTADVAGLDRVKASLGWPR
jgi:hypothetical protein